MQGENNPLQDSFIVSLRDLSQLDATVMQLQKLDKVEDVTYDGTSPKPSPASSRW